MRLVSFLRTIHESVLLEARIDFLRDKYAETLQAEAVKRRETHQTNVNTVFELLAQSDPTDNKQFLQWMIKIYLKGNMRLEDAYKATEYLMIFLKAKRQLQPQQRDINRYGSLQDLFAVVSQFKEQELESGKEQERALAREMHTPEHAEILANTANIKVVIPKTQDASCYFGRNTEWCTAASGSYNYFEEYAKKGPLYILILKKENRRFQFHQETGQYMDENDRPLIPEVIEKVVQKYPEIYEAPKFGKLIRNFILQNKAHEYYKKEGMTQELVEAILAFCTGELTAEFNPQRRYFVLDRAPSTKTFVNEYFGHGYTAEWLLDIFAGEKSMDVHYEMGGEYAEKTRDLFDNLYHRHRGLYNELVKYVIKHYGNDYDEENFEYPIDTNFLVSVLEENGDPAHSAAFGAITDGYRYGTEFEMNRDLSKFFEEMESDEGLGDTAWIYHDDFDGPGELIMYEDDMAFTVQKLSNDNEGAQEYSWKDQLGLKDIEEPEYGWTDYDETEAYQQFADYHLPEAIG